MIERNWQNTGVRVLRGPAYLAHPYGGKEENAEEARLYQRLLMDQYNGLVILNAIENFKVFSANPGKWTEEEILKADFQLLVACGKLILSGNWKESKGCNKEFNKARELSIPIYILVDNSGHLELTAYERNV